MINVKVEIPKELPVKELNQYIDDVVFNAARITLDLTNSKGHFPYLSGKLNRAAMAEGVRTLGNKTYGLGADGVEYAPAVWKYPQKGTNWTNPETYALQRAIEVNLLPDLGGIADEEMEADIMNPALYEVEPVDMRILANKIRGNAIDGVYGGLFGDTIVIHN